MHAAHRQKLPRAGLRASLRLAFAWHAECSFGWQQPRIFVMSGIASISSTSLMPGHLSSLSGGKASQNSGLGAGNTSGSSTVSGDSTTTSFNADGSLTTTTVNAQGQIVATSTTQAGNQAVIASSFANQANADILQNQMPPSLLNMVV